MSALDVTTADPSLPHQVADTKSALAKAGVKYCLPFYVDVHGVPKTKSVPLSHFGRMMSGSELFTGAALDGLGQGPQDDELALHPDPSHVVQLPWRPEVALIPGELRYHGEPWPMCSRTILQQQMKRAADMGLVFNLGIECEVYIVRRDPAALNGIAPNHAADDMARAAYDLSSTLLNYEFLDEVVGHMNAMGWDVYSFDHEDANGQFEFDFAYADAVTMADRFVIWRLMMKEIARKYGWEATMMPKPYADRTGSGAHFNMSLADIESGRNVSGDAADPRGCGLSKRAYQFIAGVKRHAPAIVATTCPTVNSYKRLIKTGSMTGYTWAPIFVSYGGNNRTHMLRVPMLSQASKSTSGARWECRAVDTSLNPYLAAAMMLAAGLDGIEQDLDPGDPIPVNMYELDDAALDTLGVTLLPRTLLESIEAFERDPLGRAVMGDALFASYVELKKKEWWDYHNQVSAWEVETYLTKF
ncbi:type III glutamate--ammonia ligase [Acuticoccus mangrovi]|uniref:Type III glutamate--ammonia ligase n=1 Tax=Acuticoccus mangrovi TaxID=2796142 RepID=A0A934MLK1_9HYPH|nr:type III glutamate--ammonia ligase [Acuticoccus mangrovi]MBJ3776444.1 type III glutamate--ammonia ligase [Acuticoccus mangrovi]